MATISDLNELTMRKIVSYLPIEGAACTGVLSRRWRDVWKVLERFEFEDAYATKKDCRYVKRYLESVRGYREGLKIGFKVTCDSDYNDKKHRAKGLIEEFRIKITKPYFTPEDLYEFVNTAVKGYVRHLDICFDQSPTHQPNPEKLPCGLYSNTFLVTLKLEGSSIAVNVVSWADLCSLKTLHLVKVKYCKENTLVRLLSVCPDLEELVVALRKGDGLRELVVRVDSLLRLSVLMPWDCGARGSVIMTPSLTHFTFVDQLPKKHICEIEIMHHLKEAYVDVVGSFPKGLVNSVTRLSLCIASNNSSELVFGDLEHLENLHLCLCHGSSLKTLSHLLNGSPNLTFLELFQMEDHDHDCSVKMYDQDLVLLLREHTSVRDLTLQFSTQKLEENNVKKLSTQCANSNGVKIEDLLAYKCFSRSKK